MGCCVDKPALQEGGPILKAFQGHMVMELERRDRGGADFPSEDHPTAIATRVSHWVATDAGSDKFPPFTDLFEQRGKEDDASNSTASDQEWDTEHQCQGQHALLRPNVLT